MTAGRIRITYLLRIIPIYKQEQHCIFASQLGPQSGNRYHMRTSQWAKKKKKKKDRSKLHAMEFERRDKIWQLLEHKSPLIILLTVISVSFISSKSQHGSAVPHGRLSPTHLPLLLWLHLCRFLAPIDTSEHNHAPASKYPSTPASVFSICRGSCFPHYPFVSFQSSHLLSHSVSSPLC